MFAAKDSNSESEGDQSLLSLTTGEDCDQIMRPHAQLRTA